MIFKALFKKTSDNRYIFCLPIYMKLFPKTAISIKARFSEHPKLRDPTHCHVTFWNFTYKGTYRNFFFESIHMRYQMKVRDSTFKRNGALFG